MARLLGLLLLIGLGWLIVKRALGPVRVHKRASPPRFEKTVRCARCGVHLPLALARRTGDDHICNDDHCRERASQRDS